MNNQTSLKPEKGEMSTFKWIFFPALTAALGLIVASVNIWVFGWKTAAIYIPLLGVILAFSIAINKYTSSKNRRLALAAFVCEIFLITCLIVNAGYSLYVMRDMQIADKATAQGQTNLQAIAKLSKKAQSAAVDKMPAITSSAQVFKDHEAILLGIFIGECGIYAISLFLLIALGQIWPEPKRPDEPAPVRLFPYDLNEEELAKFREYQALMAVYNQPGVRFFYGDQIRSTRAGLVDSAGRLLHPVATEPADVATLDYDYEMRRRNLGDYAPSPRWTRQPEPAPAPVATSEDSRTLDSGPTLAPVATEPAPVATDDRNDPARIGRAITVIREHLRRVAADQPGKWYKVDYSPNAKTVYLRWMTRENGGNEKTIGDPIKCPDSILAAALTTAPEMFHARLVNLLKRKGLAPA